MRAIPVHSQRSRIATITDEAVRAHLGIRTRGGREPSDGRQYPHWTPIAVRSQCKSQKSSSQNGTARRLCGYIGLGWCSMIERWVLHRARMLAAPTRLQRCSGNALSVLKNTVRAATARNTRHWRRRDGRSRSGRSSAEAAMVGDVAPK
jgi:hypothetical protein